ncbi:MFS transporter [Scrofimicrobium sp. R131]|uniref:MFS transporter n=1 Tax=Scrofimicrobium appendicitidis TaxID=3079930 RepID=A0AAU7V6N4_9ACTO
MSAPTIDGVDVLRSRRQTQKLVDEVKPVGKKRRITFIAFVVTMGSFLFGYDTGVISGALPYMYMPFGAGGLQLTPAEEGAVGATLLLGAAVGALISGHLSDRFGRRRTIIWLAFVFLAGTLGTAFAPTVWVMYPFRVVLGMAVGGASGAVPVYLSETAPKRIRGTIVAIDQVMIVTGQLMAFTFNAIINAYYGGPKLNIEQDPAGLLSPGMQSFDNVRNLSATSIGTMDETQWHTYVEQLVVTGGNGSGWRIMLLIATIPAILLWVGMRMMPESPRWFAARQDYYHAIGSLKRIREEDKDGAIADEIMEMAEANEREKHLKRGTFRDIMRTPWLRKLFFVGAFIAITNQTTGVNTVMYYAPKVLEYAGMGTSAAITAQVANGVMSVIGCVIALWLIGRFRRRQILITCLFGVFLTLGTIAAVFGLTVQPAMDQGIFPPMWAPLVILALMGIFMLVVQAGNGPVVWTMLGEMFPARVRGVANGSAVFILWVANAIVTWTFPPMMASLGGAKTYGIYAAINLVFGFILWKIMPETSNRSLEQIEEEMEARYSK